MAHTVIRNPMLFWMASAPPTESGRQERADKLEN